MMKEENHSEVARLRQQIAAEYAATQRAMFGPALGVAQHAFITARMERMSGCLDDLASIVGIEEAARMLVDAMESAPDALLPSSQPGGKAHNELSVEV